MDTSKEFVLMCEKAMEIQNSCIDFQREPHLIPDLFSVSSDTMTTFSTQSRGLIDKQYTIIWLPRQDQLQKMIDWSGYSYVVSCQAAQINDFYNTLKEVPDSMEQLWLAFVMFQKYQKRWDQKKKDWVHEKN